MRRLIYVIFGFERRIMSAVTDLQAAVTDLGMSVDRCVALIERLGSGDNPAVAQAAVDLQGQRQRLEDELAKFPA